MVIIVPKRKSMSHAEFVIGAGLFAIVDPLMFSGGIAGAIFGYLGAGTYIPLILLGLAIYDL